MKPEVYEKKFEFIACVFDGAAWGVNLETQEAVKFTKREDARQWVYSSVSGKVKRACVSSR